MPWRYSSRNWRNHGYTLIDHLVSSGCLGSIWDPVKIRLSDICWNHFNIVTSVVISSSDPSKKKKIASVTATRENILSRISTSKILLSILHFYRCCFTVNITYFTPEKHKRNNASCTCHTPVCRRHWTTILYQT